MSKWEERWDIGCSVTMPGCMLFAAMMFGSEGIWFAVFGVIMGLFFLLGVVSSVALGIIGFRRNRKLKAISDVG